MTVAARNMFFLMNAPPMIFIALNFFVACFANVQAVLCCWILVGESSLAVVHLHACLWGFPSGTSRLSPVDCLRSLSMRIWPFTLRVMQPDVSQEDNDLRETW